MDTREHLMTLLMEECAEVSQACSKALRFGLDEKRENHAFSNAEYISMELSDVLAIFEMLAATYPMPNPFSEQAISDKKARVAKWMEYSRERGMLQ